MFAFAQIEWVTFHIVVDSSLSHNVSTVHAIVHQKHTKFKGPKLCFANHDTKRKVCHAKLQFIVVTSVKFHSVTSTLETVNVVGATKYPPHKLWCNRKTRTETVHNSAKPGLENVKFHCYLENCGRSLSHNTH